MFQGIAAGGQPGAGFSPIDSLSTGRSITWATWPRRSGRSCCCSAGSSAVIGISHVYAAGTGHGASERLRCEAQRQTANVGVAHGACCSWRGDPATAPEPRSAHALGLTRVAPLENAPPVLAFTTVALGGFRGLIANALWIRANELAGGRTSFSRWCNWPTGSPSSSRTSSQVWLVQAWNMAYNISVKFKRPASDRWRWVQRGIELLRDEGLRYNPNEPLLYRELAWFFQHKMGQNLDDAHLIYKYEWAKHNDQRVRRPTSELRGVARPADRRGPGARRVARDKYKMDAGLHAGGRQSSTARWNGACRRRTPFTGRSSA